MIESKLTSEDRVFIEQSVVAEENLIRLALEAEKFINSSAKLKDIVNDCLVSSGLLRQAREAFKISNRQAHFVADDQINNLIALLFDGFYTWSEDELVSIRPIVREWLATLNQPEATEVK